MVINTDIKKIKNKAFFMIYTNVWAKLNKIRPKGKNSHFQKKNFRLFTIFSRLYLYFPDFSRFGKLLGKINFKTFLRIQDSVWTLQTTPASVQRGTWIQSKSDALTIFLHCPLKSTLQCTILFIQTISSPQLIHHKHLAFTKFGTSLAVQ